MLTTLTTFQLFALLVAQPILIVFGLIELNVVNLTDLILAIIFLSITLMFQYFLFSRLEKRCNSLIRLSNEKRYVIVATIVFFAQIWLIKDLPGPLPLASLQGIDFLGLTYKLASVVIPAFAFTVATSTLGLKTKIYVFVISAIASLITSIMVLSKLPIFPYILFIGYLFITGRMPRWVITFVVILLSPILFAIYELRAGPEGEANFMVLALTRFPLIIETTHIFNWLASNTPFYMFDPWSAPEEITTKVFDGVDGTGIAPSFLGYFLINFGPAGILLSLSFVFCFYAFLRLIDSRYLSDRFLYFLWINEVFHFLLDGTMTFYTSTTDAKMFWGLVFVSVFRMAYRLVRDLKSSRIVAKLN